MHILKSLLLSLCFLLVLSLCLPAPIEAKVDKRIATMQEVKGDVFFQRGEGKREFIAAEGVALTQGDRVRTGKDSSVSIIFEHESEIVLGAESQVLIAELADHRTTIKLSTGGLWNKMMGLPSAEAGFYIETPTSVMGVHGTLFHIDVGAELSTLRVFDGIVGVNRHHVGGSIEVGVFEQLGTDLSDTIFAIDPLDMDSFLQVADPIILVKVVQDLKEAIQLLDQNALENERLFHNAGESEAMLDAVEDAYSASLLAQLATVMVWEIERSTRYEDVQREMNDQGSSWDTLRQEIFDAVQKVEETIRIIEEAADKAGVSQERRDEIGKPIHDLMERLLQRHPIEIDGPDGATWVSTPNPNPKPKPDPEPNPEPEPITELEVTVAFEDGLAAVASGSFAGIEYDMTIPKLTDDGEHITFTLHKPDPSIIPPEVGPVHALGIRGLGDRVVEFILRSPVDLVGQASGFHYVSEGRWEPVETQRMGENLSKVSFESKLSVVAVAADIPTPVLTASSHYLGNASLSWDGISGEGISYELFRDDVMIFSTEDMSGTYYLDTGLTFGQSYSYTVKAVRHGFASMPSHEVSIIANDATRTWLDTAEDGAQLILKAEGFPHDKPIVGLQIHLGFAGGRDIDIESFVSSGSHVTSNLLGGENQTQFVKGFNSSGVHPAELMIAQMLFGDGLKTGYVITGNETVNIDLSRLKADHSDPFDVQIIDVTFVDTDGQQIELEIDKSIIQVN